MQKISNEDLHKLYEHFRLAGTLMAKSIVDDRLIDLPLSSLWWDILLGRKMNLFDLEKLDKDLFKVLADLQLLANKKREIDKSSLD
jgi:E3 ubiquitin-protein ligase TRIP12